MQVALHVAMARPPHARLIAALAAALVTFAAGPASAVGYKVARVFQGPEYAYGNALAATARHLVVGSVSENFAAGAAYVYDRDTGALRARLTSPEPRHFFGHALAVEGDLVAVGEQSGGIETDYQRAGAVHLYDAETGQLLRTLVHPDPTHHFGLGTAVAIVDGQVFATAPFMSWRFDAPGGVLYVFDAATGALLRTIDDPASRSAFGSALAVTDDEILVGDYDDSPGGGAVWRFDRATGVLLGALRDPDPEAREFGAPLAVFGGRAVVGGEESAFVFDLATGTLERTLTSPFPDREGFTPAIAIGPAGILTAQPIWASGALPKQVGAALLFDPDSGALRAVVPERPEDVAADPHRYFAKALLLDGDGFFVSTSTDTSGANVIEYRIACGDGTLDGCERCDDGNRVSGDGCDAECRLESCGDGIVQAGEDCDDGNAVDGDGCDTTCTVSGCGNCVIAGAEQCDDGNGLTGDACDANCTWPACGNGARAPSEGCDDGNATSADGCSPVCKAEVCGDGTLDAGESCDDGNVVGGDGCDTLCRLESAKLDWWRQIYGVFGGDVGGALFSTGQVHLNDRHLFVLAHAQENFATAYDRETGERVQSFPSIDPSALAVTEDGVFVVEDAIYRVVHQYDGDGFALRRTFEDPTPEHQGSFGRALAAIGGDLLVQEPNEHALHVFDAESGAFVRTLAEPAIPGAASPGLGTDFGAVMTAFRGGVLVSGTSAAYLLDLTTGVATRTFRGPSGAAVAGRSVVPVGDDVLAPATDGTVWRLDGGTGAVVDTFAPPAGYPANATYPWSTTPFVAVLGDEIAIAYPLLGVVHVHDAATNALRRVLRDPEPDAGSCFGAPLARVDFGLAVSDPCAGEDRFGVVYLFDDERSQLIATIPDPWGDYDDFFGTRGAFGNTLLTKYQGWDEGSVSAWRPTMDGVVDPGEECDDGNLENGDGCDVNGTGTRCGNGFVTDGETCDDGNRRSGDGCEADCTPSFACAEGAGLARARLTLRNLGGNPGDEQIVLTGHLTDADPDVAASTEGAQVLIVDATGTSVFELTARTAAIPPGPRGGGCGPHDGWRVDRTREIYVNKSGALTPTCAPGSAAGLNRLTLAASADGRALQLRARRTTIPAFTSPLRVVVALGTDLDTAGRCGGHTFAELECRWNHRGTSFVCH